MATQKFQSIPELFFWRVGATPDKEAFRYPTESGWKSLTWKEVGDKVRTLACGWRALGLKPEQRVALLASTRMDWILADNAILAAAGATTTIYPSSTAADCAYILADAECAFCVAEDDLQVKKILSVRDQVPKLQKIVTMDGQAGHDGFVITLADLARLGAEHDRANPGDFEDVMALAHPDSLATLMYTSGTTGKPKGVRLVHDCWLYEGEAIEDLNLLTMNDTQFLWLPLAHSFGKVMQISQLRIGFPTAVDGRVDKIVDNLAAVRPTFVAAVPRIFEKVHNKVVTGAQEAGGLKRQIFDWAFGVGHEVSKLKQQGKEATGLLALKCALAHKLVFSKLHARFGGRLRFFISGGAPLSREVAEFFHAAGVLILEGYGLTETSAASFVNRPHAYKFGTVGPPLPGTEVKIAEADGEVLIRGRGVMRGYHNLPEETAEALDAEGWMHTGDIGEVDQDGFLRITDRKKDLIKTSGGKYIAPQSLEGKLKALCPYVSQVVVHGDNRNFCVALITLDEESTRKWASENGVTGDSFAEIVKSPKVKELIQGYVNQLNSTLASYETLKDFAILPVDFTIDAGEITPSLKVKRKVVETKYKSILDAFYERPRGA
jgi:long-chain acyl-CoA synthetase